MSEKQETSTDIIAEMRIFKCRNLETGELEPCNAIGNYFADRIEAAHNREREASGNTAALCEALKLVKAYLDGYTVNILELRRTVDAALSAPARNCDAHTADPDWKNICAKCKDGDIEPKNCEYYGEPNGCNSPTYGEHPTAEKSSVVGDCAKLREPLIKATTMLAVCEWPDGTNMEGVKELMRDIDAALDVPPRNCDRFASAEEAWDAYDAWVESYRAKGEIPPFNEFGWLFAPATKKEGGAT